ncbi:MAG: hypothetical protein SGPRY_013927, partial [Prymnesium sp.]
PRWTFPPLPEAIDAISRLVASELSREPSTLFLVGSYQVGKEKAFTAAAIAARSRALLPPRRALSLRLCGEWDDRFHTETDGPDVQVHVTPLGGMGQEAHAQMLRMIEASEGRFKAAVSIRPTGWTYTKAMEREGTLHTRVWAENEGRTRLYGVPYSEHSSYAELQPQLLPLPLAHNYPALVDCFHQLLVNAENSRGRERLEALFAPSMDLARDKRKLDWHFRRAAEGEAAAGCSPRGEGESGLLASVDLGLQKRLSLLEDGGDEETAVSIHFGVNGGKVPDEFGGTSHEEGDETADLTQQPRQESDLYSEPSDCQMAADSVLLECERTIAVSGEILPEELELPPGCVAWVLGKEFRLYKSREALQSRLRELGAAVVGEREGRRHSKQEVTLIVIPEGSEVGSVPRSACPSARVVHESWVVRRAMALRGGLLHPQPNPPAPRLPKKRTVVATCTGEK